MSIADNLREVRRRIDAALTESGRTDNVTLVAVTKYSGVPEVLEAILKLYPLDPYVKAPVALMAVVPGDTVETPIWDTYHALCDKSEGRKVNIEHVERFAFYERAKKAYCVVMTGETALYANIILKKGVVTE